MRYLLRDSRFGPVALLFEESDGPQRVRRVILPRPGQSARAALRAAEAHSPARRVSARIRGLADRIAEFLSGEPHRFDLREVALADCPAFQQRVLRAEHSIPRGRVSSYGRIADALGSPGASRAVGNALARNPFPIVIPCHRALRSDRTLGGYQGGQRMKRALLEAEGICFDARGRALVDRWHEPRGR
jgi:methylated-DNA-[protein]-cysteine S-methyltransferase